MRDMAQLRLQVGAGAQALLLLLVWLSPKALWQTLILQLSIHPAHLQPPTLPRVPSWPPRSPSEARSSQSFDDLLLPLLSLSLLFLSTLTFVSVYFSSKAMG